MRYGEYLKWAGVRIPPRLYIILSVLVAVAAGGASLLLGDPILSAFLGFVILDLLLGFPYYIAMKRVDTLERNLPDALRQIATTLRSGGTFELALNEVVQAEYPVLSDEIAKVLREMEEGSSFVDAMQSFSDRVPSRILKRTVTILVDASRAGGGLADVLDEIADDVREIYRILRERKARTTMQGLFMVAAGIILAPMILGAVMGILAYLIQISSSLVNLAHGMSQAVSPEAVTRAKSVFSFLNTLFALYVFVEAVFTTLAYAYIREGNLSKAIIYLPVFLLVAYVSFGLGRGVVGALVR